ncbi:MAG: hypothetical protein M1830_002420 [Pleopsidium flavum]|nr:MAG: hypothetical protein M1830_002420 [Pleopsidium flavum]
MHVLDQTGRALDDSAKRDVINYKKALMDEYKLRRLSKKKAVMSVDDLYHKLVYHWVHDYSIIADEQQRNQVSTDLLMAAYFGCRPLNNGPSDGDDDQGTMIRIKRLKMDSDWGEDRATLVNCDSDVADDASTCYDSESDSGTDDGINVGLDETRLLLWRHMTSFIAPNPIPREPNIRFTKVTLICTNGEDNRPRE